MRIPDRDTLIMPQIGAYRLQIGSKSGLGLPEMGLIGSIPDLRCPEMDPKSNKSSLGPLEMGPKCVFRIYKL